MNIQDAACWRQNSHCRRFVSLSPPLFQQHQGEEPWRVAGRDRCGGKLQVRGCSFGSDELSIASRPGVKDAIVTENNGVRGVEILNDIGDQAVVAYKESAGNGPRPVTLVRVLVMAAWGDDRAGPSG